MRILKDLKDALKIRFLLILALIIGINCSFAQAFIFDNKDQEIKKAKKQKMLLQNSRYLYFKRGMLYVPPEKKTKGSVDLSQ